MAALFLGLLFGISAAHAHTHSPKSGTVALDVYASGDRLDLLTAEKDGAGSKLVHQFSIDGGKTWSEPHPIPLGDSKVHSPQRGNDPQVVAAKGRILVAWTAPGKTRWGDGPFAATASNDGGKTWKKAASPSDVKSREVGHGFLDLVADSKGGFHAVWLDSRDGGSQGVRYSFSADSGKTWGATQTLKADSCECCWNRVYSLDGASVQGLYRDRDPRDMILATSADQGKSWKRSPGIGAFGWKFKGCPDQGGALAATKDALHAFVWTGKEGQVGLHHSSSSDGGTSWSAPTRVGSEKSSHVDAASRGQTILAVWDAQQAIGGARSEDGGATWKELPAFSTEGHKASHPRVIASAEGFVVLWTETGSDSRGAWQARQIR